MKSKIYYIGNILHGDRTHLFVILGNVVVLQSDNEDLLSITYRIPYSI